MKKFLAFLLALTMLLGVGALAEEDAPLFQQDVMVLFTSDVHCGIESNFGYAGLAMVRDAYKNAGYHVLLVDNGDTIQGTPLTYYYAFMKKDVDDPAMKVMRMMDYDMWVVGNHEFNYGMDILQRQLNYLTSESTETESKVGVSMANYLDANTNND